MWQLLHDLWHDVRHVVEDVYHGVKTAENLDSHRYRKIIDR
jgi:hypothetical protein